MPEPTVADLKVSVTNAFAVRQDSCNVEVTADSYSDSADMDAELRIIEPSMTDQEPERASTEDAEELTPQDLSVHRTQQTPSPITLSDPMPIKNNGDAPPASRKRKSTSPVQDRRAKWALANSCELPALHEEMFMTPKTTRVQEEKPLTVTEINERCLLTNSAALAMQAVALANEMSQQQMQNKVGDNNGSPLGSNGDTDGARFISQPPPSPPQAPPLRPTTVPQDDEEFTELMVKLARAQEEFRADMLAASGRLTATVEESVRTAITAVQAKSLSALSASSVPQLGGLGQVLPQLADVNGNPALFNLKDMSKSVELMLASQALPYRFMAAAAAANRMVHPLSYAPSPVTSLLQTPMPPAFPTPTIISNSPLNGEISAGEDSDGDTGDGSPLNMSKKKRTKVTDNHLRNSFGLPMDAVTAAGVLTPTLELFNSVAQSAASAAVSAVSVNSGTPLSATPTASLTSSPLRGPAANFGDLSSSTLTPVHLRKAKLMFFYTRYPNSNVLKVYFPDVRFNKHNTAQIVKWFSNFREFYYIQIEKFARQAISEGVQEADEIAIMPECELVRTLNVHYNRNNQIQPEKSESPYGRRPQNRYRLQQKLEMVPNHFVHIVGITVREFFKALVCHKDQDHSWKKPIYKIIARYDQPVPEEFKSSNWIDHLEG